MDIDAIYKDSKLYKVNQLFPHSAGSAFSIPDGFNGVAVLYENEDSAVLGEDQSAFLYKVIEAGMRLKPAHVLVSNMCYTDVSLQKLAEHAKAHVVIIFGLRWLENLNNANISKNEVVKLFGMKVLVTDALDVINANDAAKKAFWVQLKKIL
jgi:hypothetical protein